MRHRSEALLEVRLLRLFDVLYQTGSVSGAADRLGISLDPPMRSLGVTVSASLGSFVALCLGWVCRIRRCARLFHCGFLVVPVLGGWSARGEGGWAERCGVERVELVLPGPAGG